MSESRQNQIDQLFHEASDLPAEERSDFLDAHCSDPEFRNEVERLLHFDELKGGGLSGQFVDRFIPTQEANQNAQGPNEQTAQSSTSGSIDHGRFLPGTILSDRYRIVGMLGQGGMGEVYRADDLELGQSVALKFLPASLVRDNRALERFRAEVRLSRQVSHPNVCRVYDIGQIDGQWFLSMEYVDGEDLAQLLRRIGRFPQERATELARQLCLGLQAAHEKGVLHRDLKPANVMIDGRGKLLITDFGLAEIADNVREDDIRSGTPAYMSPEQLAGREVTKSSDIYSLGIILHEIFTGKAVWEAESMADLLEQRQSGADISSSNKLHDLDPVVHRVIERCLEPDPAKRPETALNVIASLPGGDPLAAALGAGELPSPEMVAAAGDNTKVNVRLAGLAILGIAISLLLACWLEDFSSTTNKSGLDEPDVLRKTAWNFIRQKKEEGEEPGFVEELGLVAKRGQEIHGFDLIEPIDPKTTSFWYRYRPRKSDFTMHIFWSSSWAMMSWARPDFFHPIFEEPGEIAVVFSGNGQLRYFRAAPNVGGFKEKEFSKTQDPNWSKWFERSGYTLSDDNEGGLEKLENHWWAPRDVCDAVGVWRGKEDNRTFYIGAAAFRGKPTYFHKWFEKDQEQLEAEQHWLRTGKELDSDQSHLVRYTYRPRTVALLIYIVLFGFGAIVAWRNIRMGEVDQAGANRVAIYVFFIYLATLLGYCRYSLNLDSMTSSVLTMGLAQVVFETVRIWVWYLALEPYVRRIWPQTLITSSRLLEGRLRDPLVGRDILAGVFTGALGTAIWRLNAVVQTYLEGAYWSGLGAVNDLSLSGPRETVATLFAAHGFSFFLTTFVMLCLLLCRVAFRSEVRAIVAAIIVIALFLLSAHGGTWYITIFAAILNSALALIILVRFGVLAVVVYMTCRLLLDWVPLTLDFSNWLFEESGVGAILFIVLVSIVGFRLAISNHVRRSESPA